MSSEFEDDVLREAAFIISEEGELEDREIPITVMGLTAVALAGPWLEKGDIQKLKSEPDIDVNMHSEGVSKVVVNKFRKSLGMDDSARRFSGEVPERVDLTISRRQVLFVNNTLDENLPSELLMTLFRGATRPYFYDLIKAGRDSMIEAQNDLNRAYIDAGGSYSPIISLTRI
ncbi:MAG TPA: hypothetical protein VG965_01830 [Patescibacteria group bacterium]|nr:hypothetical protein [Patescibacteria group bacterium]